MNTALNAFKVKLKPFCRHQTVELFTSLKSMKPFRRRERFCLLLNEFMDA